MAIHLGRLLPAASSNQPERQVWKLTRSSRKPLAVGMAFLFGLAPGGACRAISVARNAVRSYRTLSPLPRACRGGLLSVALSLGSPPPGVTRHPVSMEPGLSSTARPGPAMAAIRPAGTSNLASLPAMVKIRCQSGCFFIFRLHIPWLCII